MSDLPESGTASVKGGHVKGTWPPRHIARRNKKCPAYGQRMVMGRAMQTLSNGPLIAKQQAEAQS